MFLTLSVRRTGKQETCRRKNSWFYFTCSFFLFDYLNTHDRNVRFCEHRQTLHSCIVGETPKIVEMLGRGSSGSRTFAVVEAGAPLRIEAVCE